jgi:hypothetical protein
MVSGEDEDALLLSTQDKLVESKDRSRTLELRSFSCPDVIHEFEFEVRISDQIQTVKMANGSWAKFEILFEYYEFALGNNISHTGEK